MVRLRPSRLVAAAATGLGAILLGWSLGGVASVDRELQAAAAPAPSSVRPVSDHRGPGGCPGAGHDRGEI